VYTFSRGLPDSILTRLVYDVRFRFRETTREGTKAQAMLRVKALISFTETCAYAGTLKRVV
jgi:hypothetical protein